MYRQSVVSAPCAFYAAVFVVVFIAIVLLYLPALFRHFGGDREVDHRTPKDRKSSFGFVVQNVFVLLLLAVVFALCAHFARHL